MDRYQIEFCSRCTGGLIFHFCSHQAVVYVRLTGTDHPSRPVHGEQFSAYPVTQDGHANALHLLRRFNCFIRNSEISIQPQWPMTFLKDYTNNEINIYQPLILELHYQSAVLHSHHGFWGIISSLSLVLHLSKHWIKVKLFLSVLIIDSVFYWITGCLAFLVLHKAVWMCETFHCWVEGWSSLFIHLDVSHPLCTAQLLLI